MPENTFPEALRFAPPEDRDDKQWEFAEQQALAFPARYRDKCKQLAAAQRDLAAAKDGQGKQFSLVVRNLIAMIDTCQAVLAEHPPPAAVAEAGGEELASMALGKVVRAASQILEQLGVVPVELLGTTYDTVAFNGQRIEEPFEVVEMTGKGSARTTPVSQVEASLWVQQVEGQVRVVRKGMVTL